MHKHLLPIPSLPHCPPILSVLHRDCPIWLFSKYWVVTWMRDGPVGKYRVFLTFSNSAPFHFLKSLRCWGLQWPFCSAVISAMFASSLSVLWCSLNIFELFPQSGILASIFLPGLSSYQQVKMEDDGRHCQRWWYIWRGMRKVTLEGSHTLTLNSYRERTVGRERASLLSPCKECQYVSYVR